MPRFSPETLREFISDVFQARQAPRDEADIVAEHLVQSSLMGLDSHGVIRVPQYIDMIGDGSIRPGSPISIQKDLAAGAVLDCNHNFGQVGSTRAVELAMAKARQSGVGCVVTLRNNHTGRVGAYTQMAAERGMIALAACGSGSFGHFVAPFGGREGRLATNPISFAAPTSGDPLLVDVSTSMASEGKIRVLRDEGRPLPPGWIVDPQGRPSTEPQDFYGPPRGAILPLGGPVGYKGFFFGLMVEILAGSLAGVAVDDESQNHFGLFILVIDPDSFTGPGHLAGLLDGVVAYVTSSAALPGADGVTMPGEREFQTARVRRRDGIEIHPTIWRDIERVAREVNVAPPVGAESDGSAAHG